MGVKTGLLFILTLSFVWYEKYINSLLGIEILLVWESANKWDNFNDFLFIFKKNVLTFKALVLKVRYF